MGDLELTRGRLLGDLIQRARLRSGRSVTDCAQVIGVTEEEFAKAESGEAILSLPSFEALAMYLNVPISHFWSDATPRAEARETRYHEYLILRRRIIGALIRQARIRNKQTLEELAKQVKMDPELVEKYELGLESISYFELETIAGSLGVSLEYFADPSHGPFVRHETEQVLRERISELPPEMRSFVTEPVNIKYLETAMRLSKMDVDQLRSIAEGILDITL